MDRIYMINRIKTHLTFKVGSLLVFDLIL